MQLSNTISSNSILKFIKYFIVGGFAAIVNLLIFFIFAKLLQFNYFFIGAIAFIVATFVNYLLSIKYVFISGARFEKKKEIFWLYIISIIGLIENEIILFIFTSIFHIEVMFSQTIAIGAVFIWNYIARNNFVFRKLKDEIL